MFMFVCGNVHLSAHACGSQRLDPKELEVVRHLFQMLGTELGPLQVQYMLLTTEPSPQPTYTYLY